MKTNKSFRKRLDTIFWGLLLIWWGLRWSVLAALPEGSGLLGTSLLLFGANVALKFTGLRVNSNNTFFGILSLLSGGALVVISALRLSVELPVFETILIALGVVLLGYAILYNKPQTSGET